MPPRRTRSTQLLNVPDVLRPSARRADSAAPSRRQAHLSAFAACFMFRETPEEDVRDAIVGASSTTFGSIIKRSSASGERLCQEDEWQMTLRPTALSAPVAPCPPITCGIEARSAERGELGCRAQRTTRSGAFIP